MSIESDLINISRPEPGTKTTSEIRIPICKSCGCVVGHEFCSYNCSYDGNHLSHENYFIAVYERVDTFLRDE